MQKKKKGKKHVQKSKPFNIVLHLQPNKYRDMGVNINVDIIY